MVVVEDYYEGKRDLGRCLQNGGEIDRMIRGIQTLENRSIKLTTLIDVSSLKFPLDPRTKGAVRVNQVPGNFQFIVV